MPTPTLRKFRSRLAELNDQICYSHFSDEESCNSILAASGHSPNLLTTTVFPNNPYSARIDVRCSELPEFRNKANFMMGATALISSTAYLLSYIDEAQEFRQKVVRSSADSIVDEKPEEQIAAKLSAWGLPLNGALTKTIRYLRLRRNHLAHANVLPHKSLTSLIKNEANNMTKYWAAQPTRISHVNFSSVEFAKVSVQETLSLLNLCRVCMVKVDESIIASLPATSLAVHEATEFARTKRQLGARSLADRYRKFSAHFESEYQVSVTISDAEFGRIWDQVRPIKEGKG